jgi:hypothetical protein
MISKQLLDENDNIRLKHHSTVEEKKEEEEEVWEDIQQKLLSW